MKKLLVLLLTLIVASSAFAQLTINGYNRTYVALDKDMNGSITNRLRMNLSFTDASGNFGAGGRLQSDDLATIPEKMAYGWVKLFDGKAKLTAGQFGYYDVNLGMALSEIKLGKVNSDLCMGDVQKGLLLQAYPVDGLNIGVQYEPVAAIDGADFRAYAKYTIKDVGVANFAARFSSDLFFSGFFTYTGVQNLSATGGFMYGGNTMYMGWAPKQMNAFGIVSYKMDALTVKVAPVFNITDSKFFVEGWLSYAMAPFTFNVIGAFDTDSAGLKLGSAGKTSTYTFAFEANYAVGKATLMTGVWYDEYVGLQIPVLLKAPF